VTGTLEVGHERLGSVDFTTKPRSIIQT
jgi:hypothetical protein